MLVRWLSARAHEGRKQHLQIYRPILQIYQQLPSAMRSSLRHQMEMAQGYVQHHGVKGRNAFHLETAASLQNKCLGRLRQYFQRLTLEAHLQARCPAHPTGYASGLLQHQAKRRRPKVACRMIRLALEPSRSDIRLRLG